MGTNRINRMSNMFSSMKIDEPEEISFGAPAAEETDTDRRTAVMETAEPGKENKVTVEAARQPESKTGTDQNRPRENKTPERKNSEEKKGDTPEKKSHHKKKTPEPVSETVQKNPSQRSDWWNKEEILTEEISRIKCRQETLGKLQTLSQITGISKSRLLGQAIEKAIETYEEQNGELEISEKTPYVRRNSKKIF